MVSVTLRRIIKGNMVLVLVVGLFGLITDQDLTQAMGARPWLYDYLYWGVLLLNGTSHYVGLYLESFIFDSARGIIRSLDWLIDSGRFNFILFYIVWLALVPLQWWLYWRLAGWASTSPRRFAIICTLAFLSTIVGSFYAWHWLEWLKEYRETMGLFVDMYHYPRLIVSASISGLWVVTLIKIKRRMRTGD